MTKQNIRVPSVKPIYCAAGIFALYCIVAPMFRFVDLAIALGLAVLFYGLGCVLFPGETFEVEVPEDINFGASGDGEADRAVKLGQEYMTRLRDLGGAIPDPTIAAQIHRLLATGGQIFEYIVKNPRSVRKITTFMDYYFPTALKLLESYVEFESKTIKGDNIKAALGKISASLKSIEEAFAHQLDNLYSDQALDIEADVAVLKNIVEREGMNA